jgi:hypothetical protein
MKVDRRNFLLVGSTGLVALGTARVAAAELPALLRDEVFSPTPASRVFANAFNLWMDDAVRHEEEWSREAEDVALFRKQLVRGIKPSHGAGAAARLLHYLELDDTRVIALETTRDGAKAGAKTIAPAESVLARAFNLWMYEVVRHPAQWSHEAHDVAIFRKQSALGIEPRYGARASGNLLQFIEQAQVAA